MGLLSAEPPAQLHVPDLFYIECANVFWKRVRRGEYPEAEARQGLADLRRLALDVTSTADLIDDALHIALTSGASAYDACYVALAGRLGVPAITADERLVARFSGSTHDVRWLGDLTF